MLNPQDNQAVQPNSPLLFARILWFALLISQFMLGFLIYFIKVPTLPPETLAGMDLSPQGILRTFMTQLQNQQSLLLTGGAIAVGAAAFVVPKVRHEAARRKSEPSAKPLTDRQRFKRNFTPFIIRLAMFEYISIIGFIQGFVLPGNPVLFIPFLVVSVCLHLSQFPKDIGLGLESMDSTPFGL